MNGSRFTRLIGAIKSESVNRDDAFYGKNIGETSVKRRPEICMTKLRLTLTFIVKQGFKNKDSLTRRIHRYISEISSAPKTDVLNDGKHSRFIALII